MPVFLIAESNFIKLFKELTVPGISYWPDNIPSFNDFGISTPAFLALAEIDLKSAFRAYSSAKFVVIEYSLFNSLIAFLLPATALEISLNDFLASS